MIKLALPCQDVAGEPVTINVRLKQNIVTLLSHDHVCAQFDRTELRECLHRSSGDLASGDVTWTPTPNGMVLTITSVFVSYLIPDRDLHNLRLYL